ncbi:MAG: ABC1 kinase family protein [Acidimicrobiia bacterium]
MIEIVVDDVFGLIGIIIPVLVLAWLASRLLGIRRSAVRSVITGLLGVVMGVVLAAASYQGRLPTTFELAIRVAAFSIIATMGLAIAWEFVASPARRTREDRLGRLPHLPRPVKRVRRALAPPVRFQQVLRIARRRGLLHRRFASVAGIADPAFGPCLRATLEECGGMFVKLGQVASTRGDLLPAPLIEQLTELQSGVAPESAQGIRTVVEEELGRPVEEVFASFDWDPLAAASIGQVHRAVLATGDRVVVKVQRPGIADIVSRDTQAMLSLAGFLQRRTTIGLRVNVVSLVREFTDAVEEELDFSAEARAEARVRENRKDDEGVGIPKVYEHVSTRRLLVLEEMSGRTIADAAAVDAAAVSRDVLANRLLASFLAQMLSDGVFHADPHPGNILVEADGTLALLDFGSTGVLDAVTLQALGGMLLATELNDPALLRRAVLAIAPPPPGADVSRLESDLGRFLAVHVGGGGLDVSMFQAMIGVLRRNHLSVPHSFTLLARALITLDGTLRTLAPGYSTASHATELARPMLAPANSDALQEQLQQELLRSLPSLRTLPDSAEAIANQLRTGQLSIRSRRYADPDDAAFVRTLLNRAVLAAVGLMGLTVSALTLLAAAQESNGRDASTLEAIGYSGMFLATIITMRVVALVVRDGHN